MDQSDIVVIVAALITAGATIITAVIATRSNVRSRSTVRKPPRQRPTRPRSKGVPDQFVLPFPKPQTIPLMDFVAAWAAFRSEHEIPVGDFMSDSMEVRARHESYESQVRDFAFSFDVLCRRLSSTRNVCQASEELFRQNVGVVVRHDGRPATVSLAEPVLERWAALTEDQKAEHMRRGENLIGAE